MENTSTDADYVVDLSKAPEGAEPTVEPKAEPAAEPTAEPTAEPKAEPKVETKAEPKEEPKEEPKAEDKKTKEEVIASFLTDKYNIGIDEFEDVLKNKDKKPQELPKEVEQYLKYNSETNRGLRDFVKANEDFSDYTERTLMFNYYKESNPEFDDEDVNYMMSKKFDVNPDDDTEDDIRRKNLEKKQELHKAKQHFEQIKSKYNAPLESSVENLPESAQKAIKFYQQYNDEKAKEQQVVDGQRKIFEEKTTNFFNQEFKGFEFDLGEKKISYEPKDVNSVIQNQSDLNNFIKSFLDEKGSLKDAKKYHTALHMAMNPESYAKFFYEQGRADSVDSIVKKGKNIDMGVRTKVDSSKTGTKFTVVKDNKSGFGNSLKIKR